MTQSVAIEKKSDTPLDKVNGISCIMIPWMNQKRIPANNNDVVTGICPWILLASGRGRSGESPRRSSGAPQGSQ